MRQTFARLLLDDGAPIMDFTSSNTNFFPKVDPDDAYYRYFHSTGDANELSGGYANPIADKLLEDGEATIDPAKRGEAYRRLVELIQDEAPIVITGLGDAAVGGRTPVKGFEAHIIGLLAYPGGGLQNVWLEK
jgi:peptide/nickel transport system substrate-binding protein